MSSRNFQQNAHKKHASAASFQKKQFAEAKQGSDERSQVTMYHFKTRRFELKKTIL